MSKVALNILLATEIVSSLLASALTLQSMLAKAQREGRDLTDDEIAVFKDARKALVDEWKAGES